MKFRWKKKIFFGSLKKKKIFWFKKVEISLKKFFFLVHKIWIFVKKKKFFWFKKFEISLKKFFCCWFIKFEFSWKKFFFWFKKVEISLKNVFFWFIKFEISVKKEKFLIQKSWNFVEKFFLLLVHKIWIFVKKKIFLIQKSWNFIEKKKNHFSVQKVKISLKKKIIFWLIKKKIFY